MFNRQCLVNFTLNFLYLTNLKLEKSKKKNHNILNDLNYYNMKEIHNFNPFLYFYNKKFLRYNFFSFFKKKFSLFLKFIKVYFFFLKKL